MTFWDPIQETAESSTNNDVPTPVSCHGMRKTTSLKDEDKAVISSHYKTTSPKGEDKVAISSHFKTTRCAILSISPLQDHKVHHSVKCPSPMAPKPILCCPEMESPPATSPHSTVLVQDIIVLKRAFPDSFDTIGNMPGTYTIRTDPSIPPVQHARHKVPIEYKEQIEKALDEMVLKGMITPASRPTGWVSSLTHPLKPDGSLHIYLNPKDLNKAIVQEHYKAPTLDEISHHLSGATCFSKLDAKDGFWSIHRDEDSSYLTTFNTHCGRYRFLHMPFGLRMSQDVFQM